MTVSTDSPDVTCDNARVTLPVGGAGAHVVDVDSWPPGPRWLTWPLRRLRRSLDAVGDSPRCRYVVGVALAAAVVLDVALGELDHALHLLHWTDPARDMSDLANGATAARATLSTWADAKRNFDGILHVSGPALARAHALLDVGFVVAYTVLVGIAGVVVYRGLHRQPIESAEESLPEVRPGHRAMARWALVLLPLLAAADLAENVSELFVVGRHFTPWATVLHWAARTKVFLLVGEAITLAVPALVLARQCRIVSRLWHSTSVVRVQAVVVGLFAIPLLIGPIASQAADAVRLWGDHWSYALFATVATVWFSVATVVMGARLIAAQQEHRRRLIGPWWITAAGAVVLIAGWCLLVLFHWGLGVVVLGAMTLAIGATSWLLQGKHGDEGERAPATLLPDDARRRLPAVLGSIPLFVLGVTAVHAAVPEVVTGGSRPGVLIAASILLPLLGTTLYWIAVPRIVLPGDPRRPEGTAAFPLFVGASAVALAFIWWGVLTDVYGSADRFGAFWFVSAFLGGVTLAIGFFGYYAERYRPPYALVILGFRRIPVVLLLVVWAAAGTFVDRNSNLHDVRIRRVAEEAPSRPLTTEQAFDNWVANNIAATNGTGTGAGDPTPAGAEKPAVPMVFVAASGGGIRAAAWTALVTDCLFGDHPAPQCQTAGGAWNRLFALSGASGGSVGLASAVAEHLARPSPNTHVLDRLRADLLGPSVAWQLFVEAPSALGRVNPGTDRAAVLEQAWARQWPDASLSCSDPSAANGSAADVSFLALWSNSGCGGRSPLLLLSGTSLTDGCRFNVSPLDGAPPYVGLPPGKPVSCTETRGQPYGSPAFVATRDLVDYLCRDEDVSLATAAFLSARFPFVSPAARVPSAEKRRKGQPACEPDITGSNGSVAFDGDGGYRDNTGASALMELWSAVEPSVLAYNRSHPTCIVPLFIQVDNGYDESVKLPEDRLVQALGPLTGALSVFGSRDASYPQLGQTGFRSPLAPDIDAVVPPTGVDGSRFVKFVLKAHPGVEAPLGWSLSPAAQQDLVDQLSFVGTQGSFQTVEEWLRPGNLGCVSPS